MQEQTDALKPSKADKQFLLDCKKLIVLINEGDREQLIAECKLLSWGDDIPELTHPHARGVMNLVWDIGEGCIFDYQEEHLNKVMLNSLKRSVEDFNKGNVYPAHYILNIICSKEQGNKTLETFGLSVERNDKAFNVNCALEEVSDKVKEIAQSIKTSNQSKHDLDELCRKLPAKIGAWHLSQKSIAPYLIGSRAKLGI